ncbi:MAG TPA: dephospho-CoA kinase [Burkholderiales bacterium]|nr:dephospho-CoA kinase [Burkholderiales bacterium]
MKLVVGLTGGIGCGKSVVSKMFEELGVAVVDTDEISRRITAANGAAIPAIRAHFGERYVTPSGALNREEMRALAFADANARQRLESILHPLIRAEATKALEAAQTPYAVVVVPLLIESGDYRKMVDRIVVVDCDERSQVERVVRRSALADDQIRAIISAQAPRAQRLLQADDVIHNDGTLAKLRMQVHHLHARYLSLAGHV